MGSRGHRAALRAPERFSFRTPLLPYEDYLLLGRGLEASGEGDPDERRAALARDTDRVRRRLADLLERPEVLEALFLASPEVYKSLDHWRRDPDGARGQKVERTLIRYAARMSCRPTPFGLFSGISLGTVDRQTRLELGPRDHYQRHTRLDNDYLFALCEELSRETSVREALPLYLNSSLYEAAGKYRYVEARVSERSRSYHLVAVDPSDYLRVALECARGGASRTQIARALVSADPDIDLDEALEFVDELIDAQLLAPPLAPPVTGPPALDGVLRQLEGAGDAAEGVRSKLERTRDELAGLDARGPGARPAAYEEIAEGLRELPARPELSRLFQVDMIKPAPEASLGRPVVAEIEDGIELLRRLTRKPQQDSLAEFRRRFSERFGDREVPLALALDEEVGVGFQRSPAPSAAALPLLADLQFPVSDAGDPSATWGKPEAHRLSLAQQAAARGLREIELGDADLDALSVSQPAELPDALACVAVLATPSEGEPPPRDFRVFLPGAAGPSGARLLGRFCHASPKLCELVTEHLRAEEAHEPDAVFAEIVHLPEGRIGNILSRPLLRDYEIPFLGASGAPRERQLPVSDLLVRVDGAGVSLRSRSLDRIVIPRLTTAHNFTRRSLGVYRFLCALQGQGRGGVSFSWGPLEDAPYLPRLRRGRQVLSRARWRLSKADLAPLAEAMKGLKRATTRDRLADLRARGLEAAAALRERLGLPRHVALADGDNELPVDFENPLSLDSFIQLVRSRESAVLYEEFPAPDELCARGPEGSFRHELALTFVRDRDRDGDRARAPSRAPSEAHRPPKQPEAPPRRFLPGSSWLYAKLYGGPAGADDILRDAVAPVVREGAENGWYARWFFLRYADPDPHVRVRFEGDPAELTARVLPALREAAAELAGSDLVWRVTADSYEREVERYGGPAGIELAETLFWADSEAVLAIVELLDGDEGADARWRVALRGIDLLLRDLGFDLEGRHRIIAPMRDGFGREYRVDTAFQKQLGAVFRRVRGELPALIEPDPERDADHAYAPGFEVLAERSARVREVAQSLLAREREGALTSELKAIVKSYVHMHANRLLRAPSRPQELVLYDILRRYYEAALARA